MPGFRIITDPDAWNAAVAFLPAAHCLQSWNWGEVKAKHGWTAERLLWEEDGRAIAAAQVLRRPLPRTRRSVLYVPKGPALDYRDAPLVTQVLADLEAHAKSARAVFVKIDPDSGDSEYRAVLRARRWRLSREQIQFRNTGLVDLSKSEEELLAAMKEKSRYNVRLAAKKGVVVREGDVADIPLFYAMYAETGKRDGFLIRPFSYYEAAWRAFLDAGLGTILLAEVHEADADGNSGNENAALAGLILFRFGPKAWYFYGASTERHRKLMPNYLLQWEAMRWAKRQGCSVYDLWGAPDKLDEADRLWGVWRFKEGLGAVFTEQAGAWDFVVSPLLYWLFQTLVPKYLAMLKKRNRNAEEARE